MCHTRFRPIALACLLVVGVTSAVTAQDGVSGTIVVTNKAAASASIIDVASGRTHVTLPTGQGPHEVAMASDGGTAIVTNYGAQTPGNTLTVIDVSGLRVARTIDLGEHRRPHGIAFLPGDSLVAVTSEVSRHVVIVNVAAGAIRKAIPTEHAGSHMLAFGARADRIYTGDIASNTVSELDVTAGTYVRSFDVPREPEAIGMPADGLEVWIGSNAEGKVSVVDPATGTVTTAAEGFGWPYRIVFTPDGKTVLMPDLRGEALRIVERAGFREITRIGFAGAAPQGIAITPDGRFAFLSLSQQNRVAQIDLTSYEVVRHLETGASPDGVVYATREIRSSP
jgi:DNA-binding beta-propeller fold protein YncE